jgi:transcriptional regulator with XRE-family HTH domain
MDKDWFSQRIAARGLTQERLAQAISLDRSQVSRILAGERELKFDEIERLAELLGESPLEILRHAHDWAAPLEDVAEIDVELFRLAIEATRVGLRWSADREAAFAGTAAGAYRTLARLRRARVPIDGRTLQQLEETIAGGFRA